MKHIGISEEEIIRDWSLHTEDLEFVKKFRNQYQLWVYLQVCSLKLLGQMLDNPNTLDTRIIGHACKTLTLYPSHMKMRTMQNSISENCH